MNLNVIRAIFKRNFVSYFSNPTGYVFICVFVLLVAFACFWPNEFFNNNLANLDQLNRYLPLIMLVFIPAITMSVWSEERRLGTDELLLTIPAADFDVVIGKYLAAVAIFTVSLVFSAFANWLVFLFLLGLPDTGLYLGTYFGYWMVGLAMLAIGMVASFLTGNLTVGFILGAAFNAPLAFASSADVILSPEWSRAVREWSLAEKFRDFGQGVISLVGVGFFALIVAVMLYLSMVLIGRRHWMGGRDGHSMLGHYLVRAIALLALAFGLNLLFARVQAFNRLRWDITDAKLSSLAPETKTLLQTLDATRPVKIDAYISPEVPEGYAQTRVNLLNTLREMDALGGDKVVLQVHETEALSDEAANADKQFGIQGQQVASRNRGAMNVDQIYLGVAFTCGLEKVVVPFIDRGVPVEYELIRSIATVAEQERKTIGVLATDAKLYGGFDQQTMGMTSNERIIDELQKQYEVKEVRADAPITEKFDVLLAVQPSSLSPEQMTNFLACVKSGQPTAIFEDPFPYLDPSVPGTAAPKQPPGGMNPFMQQRQPPQPKGEISPLWGMLGVTFTSDDVIWQDYNPYPAIGTIPKEFVFASEGSAAAEPFNPDVPVSSGLREMLFLFPGAIRQLQASDLKFTPLVTTGEHSGTVRASEILERNFLGQGGLNPRRTLKTTGESYVMACHIHGTLSENMPMADGQEPPADKAKSDADKSDADKNESAKRGNEINVVLVSDIDVLYSAFFQLRARGQDEEADVNLNLDNVTFVLNALDMLAGDQSFIEIRKRHPRHQTLVKFEERTGEARNRVNAARETFVNEFKQKQQQEQKEFEDAIAKLQKQKNIDTQELLRRVELAREAGQKRLQATTERLERERDEKIKTSELDYARETREQQNRVKFAAVIWPPILPLIMGVVVFFNRRAREREGVSKSRLR